MTETVDLMARPRLSDDEKRQLHSFRLDPVDRKAVQSAADAEGISFPAAAEKYLKAGLSLCLHPAMDERTTDVFVQILDELVALQERNHGHRWWKTAKAWSAAREVFRSGPFARQNPDRWFNDKHVQKAWKAVSEALEAKREAASMLHRMGIDVKIEAASIRMNGLFSFGRMVDPRKIEREKIEALADTETKETATAIFRLIVACDAEQAAALDLWRHEVEPYLKAESDGIELYRSYRRDVVREQTARGELPHYEDLI